MDITIRLPDEVGKQVANLPNRDEFLEDAVKQALEDRLLAEDIASSIQEADRGEYADDVEVKAFFDKWVRHEA